MNQEGVRTLRSLNQRLREVETFMQSINPALAKHAELKAERVRIIELRRRLETDPESHVAIYHA